MKQIELYGAVPAMRKLAAATGLPGAQLFGLLRLIEAAEREVGLYTRAARAVYAECGSGDGSSYKVTPGRERELSERLRELGDEEVRGVGPLTLDYRDGMGLSVNEIEALRGLVRFRFPGEEEKNENDHDQRAG